MLGIPTPPELGAGNATSPLVRGGPLAIGPSVPRAILDMPLAGDLSLRRGVGVATFTRSTIKTFDDRIDGLVKTAAIDVAAFETNGVLIEGASTNQLIRVEEFDNAAWSKGNNSVTANQAIAPDGTMTADLSEPSSSDATLDQVVSASATTTYTASIFIRSATGSTETLALRVVGNISGSLGSVVVNATNDFQRFVVTVTTGGSDTTVRFRIGGGSTWATGEDIYTWGAQLEELPFASSYIKTVASAVTRTADNLSIDAANIPAPTAAYSVSATVDLLGDAGGIQALYNVQGESFRILRTVNGSSAAQAFNGGGAQSVTGIQPASNIIQKNVTTSDGTTFEFFQDGISQGTTTFTAITGTKTAVAIGQETGNRYLFGHIKNFRIYSVALTAAQVGAL